MPKKNSSWGSNPKAVEAHERKTEKKRMEQDAKQKAIDDNLWKDDDKLDQKKKQRKEKEQQKKLEALTRKQETKEMLEEEEKSMMAKPTSKAGNKVLLSEIDKVKEMERKKQEQRNQSRLTEKSKITEVPELEPENPNRKMADMLAAENAVEARSVDEALSLLNVTGNIPTEDKHPEKRMKAAYNEFEEQELPILKAENPNLKLSQLKQIVHKQWQKSADNPMNK